MGNKRFEHLILLIILITSFILRWLALNQTEFANGWDTYFYLIQIDSFINTGEMHTSEWNLFYPLLLLINTVCEDPIIAVKLLACGLATGLIVACYYLAKSLKANNAQVFVGLCFLAFSPSLTYFTAQWPKNLLGLIMYTLFISALIRKRFIAVFALLIIGFFAHRMTALLSIITLLLWLFQSNFTGKSKMLIVAGGLFLLVVINFIPGLLSVHDYERFSGLLNSKPQLVHFSFIKMIGQDKVNSWWQVELILVAILWIIFSLKQLIYFVKYKSIENVNFVLLSIFMILWFPFYSINSENIPYRLFQAGMLLSPLLIFRLFRSFDSKYLYLLSCGLLLMALFSWKAYTPRLHDPPYPFYERLVKRLETGWESRQKPELIIGHKSLAEFITFYTHVDVLPWQPEYKIDSEKLYRIAYLNNVQLYNYYVETRPITLGRNYYYMKESNWQNFLNNVKAQEPEDTYQRILSWKNPYEKRPAYLLKN